MNDPFTLVEKNLDTFVKDIYYKLKYSTDQKFLTIVLGKLIKQIETLVLFEIQQIGEKYSHQIPWLCQKF
ncbi:hypothetical protein BpHYR1_034329 [Brachionus plicatilis]|uniref:Uncharacterized protein n=1 Tax=Brachionus plicatilis TaxID=10195 RepID=A0A3M7RLK0_BRAPC|nr:hypothetical protein BpHYR1_034329 [Brachionus plicatilis]